MLNLSADVNKQNGALERLPATYHTRERKRALVFLGGGRDSNPAQLCRSCLLLGPVAAETAC